MTVFSPKGGTGKTVTASNLGAALAKQGRKTLLLDLDLQFGDAAIVMGLEPEKTIYDLVVAPGELDIEKLAGYTTKHPCGLDILPAPLRPEDAELVTESKITRLLEVARECYDVDRRRHLAVLPRPDARDARPHRRAARALRARRADAEERAPRAADARAALVPVVADPLRPQPRQHEGRAEQARGRERAQGRRSRRRSRRDRVVPISVNRGTPAVISEPGSRLREGDGRAREDAVTPTEAGREAAASACSLARS